MLGPRHRNSGGPKVVAKSTPVSCGEILVLWSRLMAADSYGLSFLLNTVSGLREEIVWHKLA